MGDCSGAGREFEWEVGCGVAVERARAGCREGAAAVGVGAMGGCEPVVWDRLGG